MFPFSMTKEKTRGVLVLQVASVGPPEPIKSVFLTRALCNELQDCKLSVISDAKKNPLFSSPSELWPLSDEALCLVYSSSELSFYIDGIIDEWESLKKVPVHIEVRYLYGVPIKLIVDIPAELCPDNCGQCKTDWTVNESVLDLWNFLDYSEVQANEFDKQQTVEYLREQLSSLFSNPEEYKAWWQNIKRNIPNLGNN